MSLRIIAGRFGSRILKSLPGDDTRPTTDKVKEAVFSRIGPYFDQGVILDIFAGSGSIGLEALSRGMQHAVFIEKSRKACAIIRENCNALQVSGAVSILTCGWKAGILKVGEEYGQFDLIYADAPYRMNNGSEIVRYVYENGLLKRDGILIIETSSQEKVEGFEKIAVEKEAVYGITKVTYLREEE